MGGDQESGIGAARTESEQLKLFLDATVHAPATNGYKVGLFARKGLHLGGCRVHWKHKGEGLCSSASLPLSRVGGRPSQTNRKR